MREPRLFEQFHGYSMIPPGEFEVAVLFEGRLWREPLIGWIAGMSWYCRAPVCEGLDECSYIESHERSGTSVNPICLQEGLASIQEDGQGPASNSAIVPKHWSDEEAKAAVEENLRWAAARHP